MKEIVLDRERAYEMLEWTTRISLFHDIVDSRGEAAMNFHVVMRLWVNPDYLVKEARTRIRRRCEILPPWSVDEESFGAWFSCVSLEEFRLDG